MEQCSIYPVTEGHRQTLPQHCQEITPLRESLGQTEPALCHFPERKGQHTGWLDQILFLYESFITDRNDVETRR